MSRKRHNDGDDGGDNQEGGEEAAPAEDAPPPAPAEDAPPPAPAEDAPPPAAPVALYRGLCHLILVQAGDADADGFSDFDLRYAIEGGHGGDASEEESRALILERLASEFQTVTLTAVDADEGGRSGRGRFRGKR